MERLNLRMFDEGGSAPAADGAGSVAEATGVKYQSKNVKNNGLENVKYGVQKQEPANEPQQGIEKDETVAQKTPFAELIKGDYKEEFNAKIQSIIDERFRQTKGLEEQLGKVNPVLDRLAAKYGVKVDDLDSILRAVDEDESYFEAQASNLGMSVEQLKRMQSIESEKLGYQREINRLTQQLEAEEHQKLVAGVWNQWEQEAEKVREIFPNFDLETELQSQQFQGLLSSGIDMGTAYKVLHMDEVIGGAMQYTAAQVAQKQAANIAKKSQRPIENGISSQGGVIVKKDVSQLSKEDRREIIKRVSKGENISF